MRKFIILNDTVLNTDHVLYIFNHLESVYICLTSNSGVSMKKIEADFVEIKEKLMITDKFICVHGQGDEDGDEAVLNIGFIRQIHNDPDREGSKLELSGCSRLICVKETKEELYEYLKYIG